MYLYNGYIPSNGKSMWADQSTTGGWVTHYMGGGEGGNGSEWGNVQKLTKDGGFIFKL